MKSTVIQLINLNGRNVRSVVACTALTLCYSVVILGTEKSKGPIYETVYNKTFAIMCTYNAKRSRIKLFPSQPSISKLCHVSCYSLILF